MSHGWYVAGTYESGYVHMEDEQDRSPYDPARNTFFDLLHALPTKAGHGRMTKFSLIKADGTMRYDVDWTLLPDNARPIHYMEMQRTLTMNPDGTNRVDSGARCLKHGFGYQFRSETGEAIIKVEEIPS